MLDLKLRQQHVGGGLSAFPKGGNDNRVQNITPGNVNASSGLKRYVSFYFTNFPVYLSNFYLQKGFEVCGILEDVYVARKRNKLGQPYGFVRFSNVRDISKLSKALNAVCFGEFRVRASVARFDRNDVPLGDNARVGVEKADGGGATIGAKGKVPGTGAVDVSHTEVKQPQSEAPAQKALGVSDAQDGVRVGEALV
jgi:hypothetical protein